MTDQPELPAKPAIPTRKTGLSPKEQKLQALREKAAHAQSGSKPVPTASNASFRAKSTFAGKKTAFQRKAT
jgi:hypothetical protein